MISNRDGTGYPAASLVSGSAVACLALAGSLSLIVVALCQVVDLPLLVLLFSSFGSVYQFSAASVSKSPMGA